MPQNTRFPMLPTYITMYNIIEINHRAVGAKPLYNLDALLHWLPVTVLLIILIKQPLVVVHVLKSHFSLPFFLSYNIRGIYCTDSNTIFAIQCIATGIMFNNSSIRTKVYMSIRGNTRNSITFPVKNSLTICRRVLYFQNHLVLRVFTKMFSASPFLSFFFSPQSWQSMQLCMGCFLFLFGVLFKSVSYESEGKRRRRRRKRRRSTLAHRIFSLF
uniref:Uncharacterized protein MANES_01G020400 n=1 Tax=Rhizophora mucronata TaxID=61149 RepID=A0A2P2L5S6_RHIMU